MISVATWNVEWATPESSRGTRIRKILQKLQADIIVLTEGCAELLPEGNVVDAGTDWGYESKDSRRRKVLLWSRFAISNTTTRDDLDLPSGRFVSSTVHTPVADIDVFGVCIPWKDAHVRTGRKDRAPWQDHEIFLNGFHTAIHQHSGQLIVAGDFNQRIPRVTQPRPIYDQLMDCLIPLTVCTSIPMDKPLIDHIAISRDMHSGEVSIIPDHDDFGQLSDHWGVMIQVHQTKAD